MTGVDGGSSDTPSPAPEADPVRFRLEGPVAPGRPVRILDSLRDGNWAVGEELRLLAARMQEVRRARSLNCVAVTSALPGEGKSTVSAGLAAALAREPGRRVLLVEADLRRPSLAKTMRLPPSAGLGEYLSDGPDEVVVRTVDPWAFSLITAGQNPVDRPETLGSGRMAALLQAARAAFDFVLLDAAPLLPVADSVLIEDLVDGFILVVRSRQTPRAAIDEALGRLRPDSVLGLVLNDHRVYRDSYRAYAYRSYGSLASAAEPDDGQRPTRPGRNTETDTTSS